MSCAARQEFVVAGALVCLLLAGTLAGAQGVGSSGDITGTVMDASKAISNSPATQLPQAV